ncbi:hypothetical protein DFQ26_006300 [Actinomortierella ambigua]|nr:hypothetical protein DFQ26_006300 [Actinomortierella ambigua]
MDNARILSNMEPLKTVKGVAVESPSSAKTPSMVALDDSKGVGALSLSMPVNPTVKVGTGPSESRLGKRDVLVLGEGALNPNQGVVEEEDEEGEDEEGEDGEMVIGSMGVKKKHHKHHGLSKKKGGAKDDAGSGGGGAVNELDVTKGNGDDATAAGDNGNPSDPNDVNIGLEGDDLSATMREKKQHRKGHKTKIGQEDSQSDDDVALGNNGAPENDADTEVDIEGHKHKHKDDLLDNGFGSTVDFGKGGTTATGPLAVKKDPKSPPQQVPASVAPKTAPASQVHQAPQAPQAPPPPPAAGAPGQTSSDEGKYSGPSDRAPPPMGDKKSNGKSTGDESDYGTVPMFGPAQLELSNKAMGPVPSCARWVSGGAVVLASLWMLMG